MKFIKRFIFVILLLLIAFFIYRLISPTAAKELLHDLKSFSNDKMGTHFTLSGEAVLESGTIFETTGTIIEKTGALQEITGDEQLLLNDASLPQEFFLDETGSATLSATLPTPTPESTPPPTPKTTASIKTTTSTSSTKGLSSQDIRDLKTLFGN